MKSIEGMYTNNAVKKVKFPCTGRYVFNYIRKHRKSKCDGYDSAPDCDEELQPAAASSDSEPHKQNQTDSGVRGKRNKSRRSRGVQLVVHREQH